MLLTLIVFRLLLPTLVLNYANEKLASNKDYQGHIEKIGISLWRGAYQIKNLTILKVDVPSVPFFTCQMIDLSIEWMPLLRGALVGNVALTRPIIHFVKDAAKAKDKSQSKMDMSWERTAIELMPLTIHRFSVSNGEVHYQTFNTKPPLDLALSTISVVATNISNVKQRGKVLPSAVKILATCFDSGTLDFQMTFDPLKIEPTFELKQTIQGVQLVKLTDFFEAYAKFKVKGGVFDMYTEIAAKDGGFLGYVKPFFQNIEVEKHERKGMRWIWAEATAAATWLLTNPQKDQVATKISLKGSFEKTDVGIWKAVTGLLRNAFIRALAPAFDGKVHIADVPPAKE